MLGHALNASLRLRPACCAPLCAAPTGVLYRTRTTVVAEADEAGVSSARIKPFDEIPGPSPIPLFGNTWRFFKGIGNYGHLDIVQLQKQLHKEFGDIVRVSGLLGRRNQVWLFDPRHVETVLRNEGRTPLRDSAQILHYYRTVLRKDRFDSTAGTITTQGEEWKWFRSKVNHPMMHPSSARRYFTPINDISQEFIQKIQNSRDSNLELPADFMNEFFKWSIESIAAIALDTRLGCLSYDLPKDSEPQRLIDAVHVVIDSIYELDIKQSFYRYISTPGWRRFVKAMDVFTDVAAKYIKLAMERSPVENEDSHSMLHRLLAEGPAVANVMASDMLFGGVDTTSNASVALLFYLAKNPEVQKKLAEEVWRMLPESPSQPITAEIFDSMTYLKACLKESLRLSPISPINLRTTPSDLVLGDYFVPKQTDIFMGHTVMSAMEQYFPRPLSFEPERWLRDGGRLPTTHPFASLPFGFGPRTCVGRRFAELEILTLVAKMVRNFKVEYHHGDELKSRYTVINNIDIPLKFRLIER